MESWLAAGKVSQPAEGSTMPGLKMSYLEFVYMCIGPRPVSSAGFCQI